MSEAPNDLSLSHSQCLLFEYGSQELLNGVQGDIVRQKLEYLHIIHRQEIISRSGVKMCNSSSAGVPYTLVKLAICYYILHFG